MSFVCRARIRRLSRAMASSLRTSRLWHVGQLKSVELEENSLSGAIDVEPVLGCISVDTFEYF